jgi:hypothetical protein
LGLWAAAWTVVYYVNVVALPFGLAGIGASLAGLRRAKGSAEGKGRIRAWVGIATSSFAAIFGAIVLIDGLTGKARF